MNEVTIYGDIKDEDRVYPGDLYQILDSKSLFWNYIYIVSKIIDEKGYTKYALIALCDGQTYDIGEDATRLMNKIKSSINIVRIARCGQAKITIKV